MEGSEGLTIYGYSDDLVELEGVVREEIDCFGKDVEITITEPDGDGGVRVRMRYHRVWSAEVSQIGEERIPWPVEIRTADGDREPEYSVFVEIGCPEDVQVGGDLIERES